jgi:hypothetical protein
MTCRAAAGRGKKIGLTGRSQRSIHRAMARNNDGIDIEKLHDRLRSIEEVSPASTLCFYPPSSENAAFFLELCDAYRAAPRAKRDRVRSEVARWKGVMDALLAFVYDRIGQFRDAAKGNAASERCDGASHLMTALAAASIRGDGPDYRDFYMALAELFSAFREAGLDPAAEFNAMGGGIPADFHTYAVARGR